MRVGESLPDPPSDLGNQPKGSFQDMTFAENAPKDTAEQLRLRLDPLEQSANFRGDDVCRICMEGGDTDNQLLHPCKCTGSIRHIHEECLKAWLASQAEDMSQATCELCKTPFLMTMKLTRKCQPKDACGEGLTQCLFTPLLLAVLGLLILIVYLLSDKYLANAESAEQRGYTAALVVTCIISALVIVYLLFRALREACCSRKLTEWTIHNQELPETDAERQPPETKSADVSSFPTRLDLKAETPHEDASALIPPILVLPKRIKVKGVKVATPQVHSVTLTPVHQRGRQVAVTPRMFAFPASLNQSRASLNVTPRNGPRGMWTPDATVERCGGRVAPEMSESLMRTGKDRS